MATSLNCSGRSLSKPQANTQKRKLRLVLEELVTKNGIQWTQEMKDTVPSKWERHGDLILFKDKALQQTHWQQIIDRVGSEHFWIGIASALSAQRVAIKNGAIEPDLYRRPCVRLLLGCDGWVTHIDNGIKYMYDVTKCMFSVGNITEKLRIAKMDCRGEVIVDMYAGIGYFTLPFLVHAGAAFVHACEWNQDSVTALERGLNINRVQDRCQIHFGDNRLVRPEGVADRVNLGLIPSSESGWTSACRALNPITGGMMHIHGNVTSSSGAKWDEFKKWAEDVKTKICDILESVSTDTYERWFVTVEHVEHVKNYAPHINHLVVDLKCQRCV